MSQAYPHYMNNGLVRQDIKRICERLGDEVKQLADKTILISGGAGFLGSYFLGVVAYLNRKFFSSPCRVVCIDNYITGSKEIKSQLYQDNNIQFIAHDIVKPLRLRRKIDYIVHAAGIASPMYYQKLPLETIEVGTIGTKNMLEIARKNKTTSFIFFSSSEIYGDPEPQFIPTPETYRGNVSCIGPRACYDESKRLGETLTMSYYRFYNLPIKIVRPFNIYGPGMKADDYRVIPAFVFRGLKKKPLFVHGQGEQTRTFCYITDAMTAIFKVLLSSKNGEIYNVGNDKPEITMMNLAKLIAQLIGNSVKIKKITYPRAYPQDDPKRRCPDLTKIKTKLGYKPEVDLKTGLKRFIKWAKSAYSL